MLEPGAQVEKYEVLGPLGGGGQGFVYKVRHVHLHTIHALKVLDPRMVQDEPHRARFLREGRIQAMLRHPAIAAVTDVVAAPGLAGLIVEYVEGSELDDWRDQLGRMPTLEETAAIFGPVLDALAIAHAQGIVHRDLKPANILVSSVDGQLAPKILDFGIARVRSELLDGAPRTRTGVQMGTAGFMSPEQIVPSGEIDGRSDLFSLAATIHAVVGGLEPFDAPSEFQTWGRITQGDYTPLRELAPEVDDGLVALVERGLEVDRAGAAPAEHRPDGGEDDQLRLVPRRPAAGMEAVPVLRRSHREHLRGLRHDPAAGVEALPVVRHQPGPAGGGQGDAGQRARPSGVVRQPGCRLGRASGLRRGVPRRLRGVPGRPGPRV